MKSLSGLQKISVATFLVMLAGGAYFFYSSRASTEIALTLTTNADLERGLVGHWTFDGSDVDWSSTTAEIRDRTGSGNHLNATTTMSATTSPTGGVLGQGMRFLNRTDVAVRASTTLNSAVELTGDVSFGTWFKADSFKDQDVLIYVGGGDVESTDTNEMYLMRIATTSGNDLTYKHEYGAGGSNATTIFDANFATGTWYHVMFVRTNSDNGVKFYLNGALASSSVYVSDPTGGAFSYLMLGGDGITNMDGTLDDVRIYNRALSADEVKRIYGLGATTKVAETIDTNPDLNSGLVGWWTFDGADVDLSSTTAEIRDRSGSGYHGNATTTMSPSWLVGGVLGQAMQFYPRDNNAVDTNSLNAFDSYNTGTVAFWFMTSTTTFSDVEGQTLVAYVNETSETSIIQWTINSNRILAQSWKPDNAWAAILASTTTGPLIQPNTWHHAAFSADGVNRVKFYMDGQEVPTWYDPSDLGGGSESDFFADIQSTTTRSHRLSFGMYRRVMSTIDNFEGKLDDVRVYNRALSADEVKRIYGLGATTKVAETLTTNPDLETGLVGHWTFDGSDVDWSASSGQVKDRSPSGRHGTATSSMSSRISSIPGPVGQAIEFRGPTATTSVGDSIVVGDYAEYDITGALTIAAWVRSDVEDNGTYVAKYCNNCAVTDYAYRLQVDNDCGAGYSGHSINIGNGIDSNMRSNEGAGAPYCARVGEWHHVAGIFKPSEALEFYGNGQLIARRTDVVYSSIPNTSFPLRFGVRDNPSGVLSEFWDGALDDVRIYNRALSADEVRRLYELGR